MESNDSGLGDAFPTFLGRVITAKEAAFLSGRSIDTIARWCGRHGIGRQLHSSAPWRVDSVGLAVVIAGDADALAAYQTGDRDHPALRPYIEAANPPPFRPVFAAPGASA